RYTSRPYADQASLLKDLNDSVDYQKTIDFFRKSKGLHAYFERNGGSLKQAVAAADHSLVEKQESGRNYTYSELGRLIKALGTQ
ncbi:MAG: RloB domain-containing protein, partial [Bacteroidales bacterium]|nr:RloB domain-containing protein [Bacteroidales bacterium]